MSMNTSSLVQETMRAERLAAQGARNAATSHAQDGLGRSGGFAGLLQACGNAGEASAASSGGGSAGASPCAAAQGAEAVERSGVAAAGRPTDGGPSTQALRRNTEPGTKPPVTPNPAMSAAQSDAATGARRMETNGTRPDRPAGGGSRDAAARLSTATSEASAHDDDAVTSADGSAEAAGEATRSLAEWLAQMGVFPALTPASAAGSRGDAVVAGDGADDGASPSSGPLAVDAGAGTRAYRIPGGAGHTGAGLAAGAAAMAAAGRAGTTATAADPGQPGGQALSAVERGSPASGDAASAKDMASTQPEAATAAESGASGAKASSASLSLDSSAWMMSTGLAQGASAPASEAPASAMAASGAEVILPVPIDDPAGPTQLMLTVGRLARDGVQEARLHLHPAEMGPIQVRIALDGNRASIDFSAAHATTRELLESSLPALAQSMQSDGLTLAGSRVDAGHPGDSHAPDVGTGTASQGGSAGDGDAAGREPSRPPLQPGERSADPVRTRTGEPETSMAAGGASAQAAAGARTRRALDLYA